MKKTTKLISAVFATLFVFCAAAIVSFAEGLDAPELTAKNTANSIVISWKAVPGAEQYEVYTKDSNNEWVKTAVSEKKSFVDTKVKNGVTNSYLVRAIAQGAKSERSKIKQTFLSSPELKTIANTADGVKITWKKTSSADLYRIYRKDGTKEYSLIAKVFKDKNSYVDKTAKSTVTYTYTIVQQKGDFRSVTNPKPLKINFVSQVRNPSVKNSPNGVTVRWSKVSGAAGYVVYRKTAGQSNWVKAGTVKNALKFIDSKTAYGKKNYYKVYAFVKADNPGAFSDCVSLYSVNPNKKMVALTYDDGPYRPVTNKILDTLQKYNARATFFVVGSRLDTYKDCLERENKLGCQIGCHTYNHTTLTRASDSAIKSEISKTNNLVKKHTGQTVTLVRAPGGSVNAHVKSVVGYPLINWSVDTQDWKNRNADTTFANFKKSVKDGSIVLMHDLYPSTANASTRIIPYLVNNGYQIVTVSEMMDAKGIVMTNGGLYTHG